MDELVARGLAAFSLGLFAGAVGDTLLQTLFLGLLLYIAIMGFIYAEKNR